MEGQFCTNCGAPAQSGVTAGGQPAAPPVLTGAPASPVPPPAPAKKSPVVWVLAGCLGLVAIVLIVVTVGGFFVAKKVHEAGNNPAFAATKLLAQMNPNVEVVTSDEGKGTITLRDKKTGKVVTFNFEDIKNGHIVFEGENGERTEIRGQGEGESGSMEIKTDKGTARFGAGSAANLPSWLPVYPGSTPEGAFSAQGQEGTGGVYGFKTNDSMEKVADYFEQALKSAGLKTEKNVINQNGVPLTAMVSGKTEDEARQVNITISKQAGETHVGVTYKGQ